VDQIVCTAAPLSPIFRFWSPVFNGHFFTISESEKDNIVANLSRDWSYEGVAYHAYPILAPSTVPLYRFWSNRYRGHFFTISESEKDYIVANLSRDWSYEGIAYYVYRDASAGGTPVYRFWSNRYKHHFFTMDEAEKNNIIATLSADWSYEGIAYYVPSARAASPSGALPTDTSVGVDEGATAKPCVVSTSDAVAKGSAAPVGSVAGAEDVLFPLSVSGGQVTATVSDMASGAEAEVIAVSGGSVAVSGVELGRKYRLEVSIEDPAGTAPQVVHASAFERRADAPDGLGDSARARADAGTGVGNPSERIVAPALDGTLTLKLWSAARGVVETREGVVGGETVEFAIPDWNCWHWIGGWREADDALVFSLWLRHELEAE